MLRSLLVLWVCCLSVVSQANVLGEMQTFAPNTDGLDFITVHSARPLNHKFFAFSNYLNFSKDHLQVYENLPQQQWMGYSSQMLEYDFGISYAATKTLQFSLMAPFLLDYWGEENKGIYVEATKGVHSYRPGAKWSFYEDGDLYLAALFSLDFPQVKNSPYTGIEDKPIFNYELAATIKNGRNTHGINLGYRKRLPTETPTDARMYPLKDQLLASYGYSRLLSRSSRFIFEVFSSYPLNKDPYERALEASSLDVLFGMKHFWWKYLRFDWGVTVEPIAKTMSPTWRVFAGLVYYWKNDLSSSENPNPESESMAQEDAKEIAQASDYQHNVLPLEIKPEHEEIYQGASLSFEADGGVAPYQYRLLSGPGVVSLDGVYRSALKVGEAVVEVRDEVGQKKTARISVVAVPKADREIALTNLEFISGKDVLTKRSEKYLQKNINELRNEKIDKIIIEGHTDNVGSAESNLKLSQKRADFAKRALIEKLGLNSSMVKALGFGEEQPIADNNTASGRQTNRRVMLKVYYKK